MDLQAVTPLRLQAAALRAQIGGALHLLVVLS